MDGRFLVVIRCQEVELSRIYLLENHFLALPPI
jgi:hypothetical protein